MIDLLNGNPVATVLTACGIETSHSCCCSFTDIVMLQQYLPLAVLKRHRGLFDRSYLPSNVATVLTACGIETAVKVETLSPIEPVATVLTACGIETLLEYAYARKIH